MPTLSTAAAERISLALVFVLSRRCNLTCTYCNMEAGPTVREKLDPGIFHSWVSSFAALQDVDLGVQLHGGEPLMMDPPVEHFADLARDAVAPWPSSRLEFLGVVTNGTLLDVGRAQSLAQAGIQVVVSLDGSQRIHDRFRVSVGGRGSHDQAMRAVDVLRSQNVNPGIICVVTRPDDVLEALEFFIREGLPGVKINPVRPEGRGRAFPPEEPGAHMQAMADQFLLAAKRIATHNRRYPGRPIFEENIQRLMSRLTLGGEVCDAQTWTLMVDDQGDLWSHPGGHGVRKMRLTTGEIPPSPEILGQALGLHDEVVPWTPGSRSQRLRARQRATFNPCAGCKHPFWCTSFRPLTGGRPDGSLDPDCLWREQLTAQLEAWRREQPEEAHRVMRSSA